MVALHCLNLNMMRILCSRMAAENCNEYYKKKKALLRKAFRNT